ncbi:3'-5' exonuclease [Emticicia sp. BO119]|uniref:3'-5' exonuclease n=1 Tax=Emticicia sp. BO119 TaxID=2757768 RepID=UPI0015F0ACBB|nr:3'-5' exonuclease [Emticicia sp. BO119]MBA4849461.1 3'-5' exonuclease [Emticicia sp. BO119]
MILHRPIVFFDCETTGVDKENDRIIELALCKLHPDWTRETKCRRLNPEMPIPPKSTEVHGITDADVKDCPTFRQVSKSVFQFFEGCDLGGFNSNAFDIPVLFNEFARVGMYFPYKNRRFIDAGNIFKIQEPRTLSAAVKFYTGKTLNNAHNAEADILGTVDVFEAQIQKYPELPHDLDELHKFCNFGKPILDLSGKFTTNDQGEVIINFSKSHKGKLAHENLDFLAWMVSANFPADTVEIAKGILQEHEFHY